MDTAWLPVLWPTRMAMPDGAALLLIQGVPEVLECVCAIRMGRWPRSRQLRHHGCQVRNLQNSGQMDAGALSARVASGDEAIERPRAGFRSRFQYFWPESASPFSPAVGNGHRPSVATCGGKRIVPEKGAEPGGFQSARRTSWLTVSARMPNIKWQEALACPRTGRCRPPNSSLRHAFTLSAVECSWYRQLSG